MKPSSILSLLLLSPILFVSAQPGDLLIVNANVITLKDSKVLIDHDVYIRNGIIEQLERNIPAPKNIRVVDAAGRYVLPGFADMHAHVPGFQSQPYPIEKYFMLQLLKGVTTVRSMRGHPEQLKLRSAIKNGTFTAPHLYVASPPVTKVNQPKTAKEAKATFDKYKQDGYDFIKLLSFDTAFYDSLMITAKASGWTVAGHASDLKKAVRAGQKSIEHVEPFIDEFKRTNNNLSGIFNEMAKNDIYTCPDVFWYYIYWNQLPPDTLIKLDGMAYVPAEMKTSWADDWAKRYQSRNLSADAEKGKDLENYMSLIKKMNDAGVKLLLSPGDGAFIIPGFGLIEEMKLFSRAGVSNFDILRAASVNAAGFFGETDIWGTLEKGKRADLVMTERNPLDDIKALEKITGVSLEGKWIEASEIIKILER